MPNPQPEGVSTVSGSEPHPFRGEYYRKGYQAGAKVERERIKNGVRNHPNTFGITDKDGRGGAILVEDVINLIGE